MIAFQKLLYIRVRWRFWNGPLMSKCVYAANSATWPSMTHLRLNNNYCYVPNVINFIRFDYDVGNETTLLPPVLHILITYKVAKHGYGQLRNILSIQLMIINSSVNFWDFDCLYCFIYHSINYEMELLYKYYHREVHMEIACVYFILVMYRCCLWEKTKI